MNLLENIFASKAQAKLIKLFFQKPNQKFYQRELMATVGESLGSIQYEIKRLEKMGLVCSQRTKRKVFYNLNKDFYLYSQIRDIVLKTAQKNL